MKRLNSAIIKSKIPLKTYSVLYNLLLGDEKMCSEAIVEIFCIPLIEAHSSVRSYFVVIAAQAQPS